MKIQHLMEGTAPKLPGAFNGVQIMTPQQFVAKADDIPDEQIDELSPQTLASYVRKSNTDARDRLKQDPKNQFKKAEKRAAGIGQAIGKIRATMEPATKQQGVVEGSYQSQYKSKEEAIQYAKEKVKTFRDPDDKIEIWSMPDGGFDVVHSMNSNGRNHCVANGGKKLGTISPRQQGVAEATKLPAPSRPFNDGELTSYLDRIRGTPDIDKKTGKPKMFTKGRPGKEKYISGKVKSDKYKMPYIHRDSVIKYYNKEGKRYDEDQIKQELAKRPKSLLKQNEKMKHSNGDLEQFYNIGFAALTGIALDEQTNNLIIVNTCPGAGSCKVDCFVIHQGGKIQFESPWLSDGRILTYLLNDPQGFFQQLSDEIDKKEKLGDKGGYEVTIRWHDAGDFFSPEYIEMALELAKKHPGVKFYAYTKMANAALAQKPGNFIINWSEGAHTSQEKQVKAADPELTTTKNSRIVPEEMFQDLLNKDEKNKLVKGSEGQWQLKPGKLPELKERLAKAYKLSSNSILSYDEYMTKRNNIPQGMKYNVIVMGGEGDVSANDPGILSTLLLKH